VTAVPQFRGALGGCIWAFCQSHDWFFENMPLISDVQASISAISFLHQLKHTVIAGSESGISQPYKRSWHVLQIRSNTFGLLELCPLTNSSKLEPAIRVACGSPQARLWSAAAPQVKMPPRSSAEVFAFPLTTNSGGNLSVVAAICQMYVI